ncbi:MAG: hypothetical protein M1819_006344 [Sarea resinae]|nr:MAG: hypothetical protein M1819_006344 [Sarea resinae]
MDLVKTSDHQRSPSHSSQQDRHSEADRPSHRTVRVVLPPPKAPRGDYPYYDKPPPGPPSTDVGDSPQILTFQLPSSAAQGDHFLYPPPELQQVRPYPAPELQQSAATPTHPQHPVHSTWFKVDVLSRGFAVKFPPNVHPGRKQIGTQNPIIGSQGNSLFPGITPADSQLFRSYKKSPLSQSWTPPSSPMASNQRNGSAFGSNPANPQQQMLGVRPNADFTASMGPTPVHPYAIRAREIAAARGTIDVEQLTKLLTPAGWEVGDPVIDEASIERHYYTARGHEMALLEYQMKSIQPASLYDRAVGDRERQHNWDTRYETDLFIWRERLEVWNRFGNPDAPVPARLMVGQPAPHPPVLDQVQRIPQNSSIPRARQDSNANFSGGHTPTVNQQVQRQKGQSVKKNETNTTKGRSKKQSEVSWYQGELKSSNLPTSVIGGEALKEGEIWRQTSKAQSDAGAIASSPPKKTRRRGEKLDFDEQKGFAIPSATATGLLSKGYATEKSSASDCPETDARGTVATSSEQSFGEGSQLGRPIGGPVGYFDVPTTGSQVAASAGRSAYRGQDRVAHAAETNASNGPVELSENQGSPGMENPRGEDFGAAPGQKRKLTGRGSRAKRAKAGQDWASGSQ